MKPKIITIVGKSNSGKTTFLEKLIFLLTDRGYKIGSVKHAHDGFEMDKEGKDSWRHRKAGARASLVITQNEAAVVKDDKTGYIEKMRSYLFDMDLILAEGFKKQNLLKIEVFRTGSVHKEPLCMEDENLIAFVTDSDYKPEVPLFGLEDINQTADFIESNFLKS
ncbi:MAG: molybdopterin-guanine dinucleotide biosynthesis protein B [Desulfobacterales bacterium]|nr:molybdopterin-guanine dinucleotide biosynthesis protein B [Desulfobacterales bacterium]